MTKSEHHIIPRCREVEGFNVHHQSNRIFLDRTKHDAFHVLFGNLCPRGQLQRLLKYCSLFVKDEIKLVIDSIISLSLEDFFIEEVYNVYKFKNTVNINTNDEDNISKDDNLEKLFGSKDDILKIIRGWYDINQSVLNDFPKMLFKRLLMGTEFEIDHGNYV